ncbi:MAG: PAS domain S-box protein [Nitrospirota bacterium]|nr:MAG: PAS domain S-box protein [Nitrospirota bacterium]
MRPEGIYNKLKILTTFRVVFVSILLAAFYLLQVEYRIFPYPRLILILISFIFMLNIVYLLLIRRQKINPVVFAYVQLVIDVLVVNALIMSTGGIESWFTVTLLLTVIASSIVIDRKAGYVMAVLAGLVYGSMIDMQYYQVFPVKFSSGLTEKDFLYNISIILLAVGITAYLIGHLASGLQETKETLARRSLDLRELSQFHSDVIENIPSGLLSADKDAVLRLLNVAGEQILGRDRDEVIGTKVTELFNFIDLPIVPGRYDGEVRTREATKTIGLNISEHMNQDGKVVGYIGTFQDLTDIIRLEKEIKKKEKFAAIGELSANIAHEIRNPLASIKGSIEMIKEGNIGDDKRAKLMDIAIQEMVRLNNIITNFLSYSDPKPLKEEDCDISDLIRSTLLLIKSSFENSGDIEIIDDIQNDIKIRCDMDKIRQVLWNLMTNAVESLGNNGKAEVRAWMEEDSAYIEIRDSGSGIAKDDLDRIFYPFFTTKKDGTGLGLAIAYRIVDEHNGNIEVMSNQGRGTTFIITLPVYHKGAGS